MLLHCTLVKLSSYNQFSVQAVACHTACSISARAQSHRLPKSGKQLKEWQEVLLALNAVWK